MFDGGLSLGVRYSTLDWSFQQLLIFFISLRLNTKIFVAGAEASIHHHPTISRQDSSSLLAIGKHSITKPISGAITKRLHIDGRDSRTQRYSPPVV